MNNKFEKLDDNDLMTVEGGIGIGAAILIGCGAVLVIGAGVSFFNGYSDAAGK